MGIDWAPASDEELAARGLVRRIRARNDDGSFKGDDPSTPDVDEAWEPAPVKVAATKRRATKAKGKT